MGVWTPRQLGRLQTMTAVDDPTGEGLTLRLLSATEAITEQTHSGRRPERK